MGGLPFGLAGLEGSLGAAAEDGTGFKFLLFNGLAVVLDSCQLFAGGVEEAGFALFVEAEEVELAHLVADVGGLGGKEILFGVAGLPGGGLGTEQGQDAVGDGADVLQGPGDLRQGMDEESFGAAFGVPVGLEFFEVASEILLKMFGDEGGMAGEAMLNGIHADFAFSFLRARAGGQERVELVGVDLCVGGGARHDGFSLNGECTAL